MAIQSTEAIVLRRFDFGDTSQIAHVYTRDAGKVSILAKGLRSEKRKEKEIFDLLCHYGIVYLERKGGRLNLLRQIHGLDHFPRIRAHLDRVYAGLYLAELMESGTPSEEPAPKLFDLFLAGLVYLNGPSGRDWRPMVPAFELSFLNALGFQPELRICLECGKGIDPPEEAFFHRERGGILCARCRPEGAAAGTISQGALSVLRTLAKLPALEGASRIRMFPVQEEELRRILGTYINHVLEKRIRMGEYLIERV